MTQKCVSCRIPMHTQQEHAAGDESRDYGVHCARPDGSMKSYDEVLTGMTAFLVKTRGIDQQAASKAAAGMMAELPAWKGGGIRCRSSARSRFSKIAATRFPIRTLPRPWPRRRIAMAAARLP